MKTIKFEKETYEVSDWVNFVARNEDGCIYGYEEKPLQSQEEGIWFKTNGLMGFIKQGGTSWRESVTAVEVTEDTKTVQFDGKTYEIPKYFNWIAKDSDGDVTAFEEFPESDTHYGEWFCTRGRSKNLEYNPDGKRHTIKISLLEV